MKKLVLAVLLLVGTSAYGDSLTFTGSTANGEYGPYSMSLNGTPTQMICFSGVNWITGGENWNVTAYTSTQAGALLGTAFGGADLLTPPTSAQGVTQLYNELGYLGNELFADPGNADLQIAIWSVLGLNGPFTPTSGSKQDLQGAYNAVVNGNYVTTDVFYIPSGDNLPLVNGTTPQPFISEVPEPSSLMLLGVGLLGLVALSARK